MILWAEGFDAYGTDENNMLAGTWAQVHNASLATDQARTGAFSCFCGLQQYIRRIWGAAYVTVGMGAAYYFPQLPNSNPSFEVASFRDSANYPQVTIFLDSTGALSAWRGDAATPAGTKLGESTTLVQAQAWNHIECKVSIDDTAGTVEVRLNGVTVLNLTGQNLTNTGFGVTTESTTSQVIIGNPTVTTAPGYVDDIVAWNDQGDNNNDFIGDKKVFEDFPDADTADQDWTPKTGTSRFAMVDDADPDGDGSYDEATAAAQVMGFTFPDVSGTVTLISAVIINHLTKKLDAGTCNVKQTMVSSSDHADGADRPMTTAYTRYWDVFEVDPHTAAAWTSVGANAMSVKVTRTA